MTMIVITETKIKPFALYPGDQFCLSVSDDLGSKVVIKETITKETMIDFVAAFRFANEDGTCEGFHLTGIFAQRRKLPKEIREAVQFDDLTPEQRQNMIDSLGIDFKTLEQREFKKAMEKLDGQMSGLPNGEYPLLEEGAKVDKEDTIRPQGIFMDEKTKRMVNDLKELAHEQQIIIDRQVARTESIITKLGKWWHGD